MQGQMSGYSTIWLAIPLKWAAIQQLNRYWLLALARIKHGKVRQSTSSIAT